MTRVSPKVLLSLILLLLVACPLSADARRRSRGNKYNLNYLLLREQEGKNESTDLMVEKALKVARKNPEKAALQEQLTSLRQEREAVSTQIMGLRKKEVELTNAIRAYNRQRRNDRYRIKDLQNRLQTLQYEQKK